LKKKKEEKEEERCQEPFLDKCGGRKACHVGMAAVE
jgi:hypothetical protein